MSQPRPVMAIYVDGETKTGKGAASQAIATALQAEGYKVHYDVAGDFYRRYVALVRLYLDLDEGADLPTGDTLLAAAKAVHETEQAYRPDPSLGNLQRSAISRSVSVMGALPFVQTAAIEWFRRAAEQARDEECDVMVLDGRNPRNRIAETGYDKIFIKTVLDMYMTCEPAEAARRTLLGRGIEAPTDEQIAREAHHVTDRRDRDRHREDRPFVAPDPSLLYVSEEMTAAQAIEQTWQPSVGADTPIALRFDNTHVLMDVMLSLVSDLGIAAVAYGKNSEDTDQ